MTAIDLTKKLKKYKSGWVALDKNHKVIAHAETFKAISEKVKEKRRQVVLIPASDNYFGFITSNG